MGRKVFVVGVGMTKFEKPGGKDWDYPDMAREAGTKALDDAGVPYDTIEQAAVGYCYGDSTAGQRAIYELGLTGIPVVNVNNNCATGSSALYLTKKMIEGGIAECAMALGFEKMERGSLVRLLPARSLYARLRTGGARPPQRHLGTGSRSWVARCSSSVSG